MGNISQDANTKSNKLKFLTIGSIHEIGTEKFSFNGSFQSDTFTFQ